MINGGIVPQSYGKTQQLEEVLPNELFNHPHCYDHREYGQWETFVAAKALDELGYEVMRWYTIEKDSFGPLIRGVDVKKANVRQTFWYG